MFATDGQFFLTGTRCKARAGYTYLKFWARNFASYFIIDNRLEKGNSCVFLGYRPCTSYEEMEKHILFWNIMVKPFFLQPFSCLSEKVVYSMLALSYRLTIVCVAMFTLHLLA